MLTRRTFASYSLAGLPFTLPSTLHAAGYPDKPVRLVVGFPAGQASDISARRAAHKLSELLKANIFVDNKPGAAGIISHEQVKNSPADGYTLLMASSGTLAINPSLYRKLSYNPQTDFEPVALYGASPLVLFVKSSSPVKNLKDFIAMAKANPGKLTYGSGGSGTTQHIAMEMLKKQAGLFLVHIPYKGSVPMITDLIGGSIDFAFEPVGSVLQHIKSGRVRALGIASQRRYAALPDLPTIAEQGLVGFEAVPWTALLAPKGTPPAILQQLNLAVNAALKDPIILEEMTTQGSYPLGGTLAEARKFIELESQRWGKAVKASGAQVD